MKKNQKRKPISSGNPVREVRPAGNQQWAAVHGRGSRRAEVSFKPGLKERQTEQHTIGYHMQGGPKHEPVAAVSQSVSNFSPGINTFETHNYNN